LGGSDYLLGEQGDDNLLGGDGNDVLVGGEGYNILEGGAEKDTFVLDTSGVATISDFEIDNDTLAIAGLENTSDLNFSISDDNSTLIESGGNTLASLSGITESDNIEITYV
jgi:Ca2+-binding RTX toxin-like protein